MEICLWLSDQHSKHEEASFSEKSLSGSIRKLGSIRQFGSHSISTPSKMGLEDNPLDMTPEELLAFRAGVKYKKEQTSFCNYDDFSSCGPMMSFKNEVIQTFTFYNAYESVSMVVRRHNYARVLGILADWIIRWIVWTISLIIFPAVVLYVIYFIPGECTDWSHHGDHVRGFADQVGAT